MDPKTHMEKIIQQNEKEIELKLFKESQFQEHKIKPIKKYAILKFVQGNTDESNDSLKLINRDTNISGNKVLLGTVVAIAEESKEEYEGIKIGSHVLFLANSSNHQITINKQCYFIIKSADIRCLL